MSKRVQVYVVGLVCFLLGLLLAPHLPFAQAQENKVKAPIFMHGMEVRSRKAGEADFNKDTKKWGIEVYKDENNGNTIYISETGSIAVVKYADFRLPISDCRFQIADLIVCSIGNLKSAI